MSSRTIKRILKEKVAYHKDPLDNDGIFISFDDNDMLKARVLITGPEDTPYQNGFYLFEFTFTKDYPHKPPKCLYLTTHGNSRMNPNLYTNGYVCLSLLGTWAGPSWTSCNTLTSICMSLRALVLNSNPIQNEPSFEKEVGEKSERYNRLLTHENIRIAVLLMMKKTPPGFQCFHEIMKQKFKENFNWYMSIIEKNRHMDGKMEKAPIWSMKVNYNYEHLEKKLLYIANVLGIDTSLYANKLLTNNTTISKKTIKNSKITPVKTKKVYTRKAPNGKAKTFDLGFEKLSENDGNNYVIVLNKSGNKRWKKMS